MNRRDFMIGRGVAGDRTTEFGTWVTRKMLGPLTEIMSTRNALGQSRASPNGILQYALSERCYSQTEKDTGKVQALEPNKWR